MTKYQSQTGDDFDSLVFSVAYTNAQTHTERQISDNKGSTKDKSKHCPKTQVCQNAQKARQRPHSDKLTLDIRWNSIIMNTRTQQQDQTVTT